MKDKSKEYIIGLLVGVIICLTFYACSHTTLQANSFEKGTRYNPMYVRIVQ